MSKERGNLLVVDYLIISYRLYSPGGFVIITV